MDDLFPELIPDVPDGKVCVKCGVRQPEESFSIANGGSYRRTECDSCRKSAKELRDALRKIHKKPEDDYQCPICERPIKDIPFGTRSPLVLDHCHETETFRGWLCDYCNRGLGAFNDSLERLQNAIEYLRKHDGKEER